jgi:hypothetical protein
VAGSGEEIRRSRRMTTRRRSIGVVGRLFHLLSTSGAAQERRVVNKAEAFSTGGR